MGTHRCTARGQLPAAGDVLNDDILVAHAGGEEGLARAGDEGVDGLRVPARVNDADAQVGA
jgi:hypothetical protein